MPTVPGQILTSSIYADTLVGGAGDDTLNAGLGPDRLTGAGGADAFVYKALPWNGGEITDFQPGVDRLDISALYAGGYHGSDPVADGYVRFESDFNGNTKVMLDSDGPGGANPFFKLVTILDGLSPQGLTSALVFGPPAAAVTGLTLQAHDGAQTLQGAGGDDTLIGGSGPDTMTGGGGADHFAWNALPWSPGEVTDFTHGTDKLDFSGLLSAYHYSGSDPIADGWIKAIDDGHGDTWLYFDTDGHGTADPWGTFVATLDHVSASQITSADLVGGAAASRPPPTSLPPVSPPSTSPPPVSPPPASGGVTLHGQSGGSDLQGGSGDDTLIAGTGPDVMTGAAGADHFEWDALPWNAGSVTDFTHGVDHIDVSRLLSAYHYSGVDPIADGYVKLIDDGHGNTWLYFDTDGHGSADQWGTFVATLQGVSASSLGSSDFIFA